MISNNTFIRTIGISVFLCAVIFASITGNVSADGPPNNKPSITHSEILANQSNQLVDDTPTVIEHAKRIIVNIWQTELYLAKRNHYVDGKLTTIYRPVTVGKVTHLLLILIVGGLLLRYLSSCLQKILTQRFHLSFSTATLSSKWLFGSGICLLIIYGLNKVHIPFTALAFLGGTLAIGIGFGTQTILKNFISGIILMVEQPFKVGDLVEVDGINGTITNIGMRASTVQHFNGIDTLIPNSILLENQVTNWTFSDNQLRHSVLVGVSYDATVRDVERLLLEIADEHGLILQSPQPEVYFEEFGDSALNFRLLFWLNATECRRPKLASDLRFMINKRFKDAGITIPYPHQNIHFDSGKPLQVSLSSPPASSKD